MSFNPNALPYPPYTSPMTDRNGMITPAWQKWFQLLWPRVGGAVSAPIQAIFGTTPQNLISTIAQSVISTLYTAPVGQKAIISSFQITNLTGISQTISVYLVPLGQSASAANITVNSLSVAGGGSLTISDLQYQVVLAGYRLQAIASQNGAIQITSTGWVTS